MNATRTIRNHRFLPWASFEHSPPKKPRKRVVAPSLQQERTKTHSVSAVQFEHQPKLRALMILPTLPPGHMTFPVEDDAFHPHLRRGEFAVWLADHQPAQGELLLIAYSDPRVEYCRTFALCQMMGRTRFRRPGGPWLQQPDGRRRTRHLLDGPALDPAGRSAGPRGRLVLRALRRQRRAVHHGVCGREAGWARRGRVGAQNVIGASIASLRPLPRRPDRSTLNTAAHSRAPLMRAILVYTTDRRLFIGKPNIWR